MTDDRPIDDRAELALQAAFRTQAEAALFAPLDPDEVRTPRERPGSPRRTTATLALAVAAVAVFVLLLPLALFLPQGGGSRVAGPAAAPAAQPAPDAGGEGAAGTQEAGPFAPAGGPVSGGERRPESFLDVVVDVPADWGHDFAPGPDWCAADGYRRPEQPFVQRNPLSMVTLAILCPERVPDELRQTHLTWRPAAGETDADVVDGAWLTMSRVIGSAYVSVHVPAGDEAVATAILDSARVVAVDPRGCPVALPAGRPSSGSLRELAGAASASVCQYVVDGPGGPDLVGSYALDGEAADALLRALVEGPALPDTVGEDLACEPTGPVLLVRFTDAADAVREARLPTGGTCLFAWDDGRGHYEPTRATCADLLRGPLWQSTFVEGTAAACSPAGVGSPPKR